MNGDILQALRLSMTALGETTAGQVVNLMSNDVNRFDVAVVFLHYLWIGPIETFVVTYFMWNEVGPSAAIGVASLLLFIPLQGDSFSNMNCVVLLYNHQHNKFIINQYH
jgi:ATP-binding cassette subfamily C (CFTR/MRP) protein 4